MHLLATAASFFGAALVGRPLSSDALRLGIGVALSSTVDSYFGFERLLAVVSVFTTVGLTLMADTQFPTFGVQAPHPYGHPSLYISKATRTTPLATYPSTTTTSADSTNVGLWIAGMVLVVVGGSGIALIRCKSQGHDGAGCRYFFIAGRAPWHDDSGDDIDANGLEDEHFNNKYDVGERDLYSEHDNNAGSDFYVDGEEAINFGSEDEGDDDGDLDVSGDVLIMDSSTEYIPVTPPRRLVPRGEPDWTSGDQRRAIAYLQRRIIMAGDSPTPGGLRNASPSPIFTRIMPMKLTIHPQHPPSKIPVLMGIRPSFQLDPEENNPFAPKKRLGLGGPPYYRMCPIDDSIDEDNSSCSVF